MQKYFFLLAPVLFSASAQLLIKQAALQERKSLEWLATMSCSIVAYMLAFVFYSVAVRHFPISVASPVNTVMVMLLVVFGGVFFWGEPFGMQRAVGAALGMASLALLLLGE